MKLPITITISAEAVAWYGAIVSSSLLIISVLNYLKDRPSLKIKCFSNRRIYNAEPQYKSNTDYIVVTAINVGKSPVTVTTVGYISKNKKDRNGVLVDSLRYGSRELTEGKSADYLLKQEEVDLSKIKYFVVYDSVGKAYKGKIKREK